MGNLKCLITLGQSLLKTPEEWQFVFFVTASIYLFGAVFYSLTASGERQDWSKMEPYEESHVSVEMHTEWALIYKVRQNEVYIG